MYAHAWVPLATAASRAILERVYGGRERYAYFSGCSNGGRTAAKVAQRYPYLFDGIASGAPALNVTYAAGVQGVWLDRTLVDVDGQLVLRADKISLLSQAVQNRCDAQDGLTDSIVSDPFACDFDPGSLQCSDDVDDTRCLTAAEVDELHRLYTGAHDSQGRRLYAGLPYGSEDYWGRWLIGSTDDNQHYVADLGSNFLRYLGFEQDPGPDYDSRDFDLDTDIPKLAFMARLFNASDPDLSGLQQAGGKLLMYHGLADALIVPQESIAYYESVVQKFGSPDTVNEFLRLFMVPGMDHCWGITGHAPDLFDPLRVLEEWVEESVPPTRIEARQHAEPGQFEGVGPVIRTRPLCPYPQRARYKGKGSPNAAGNFDCVGPN
jgi:feruloyl esterase